MRSMKCSFNSEIQEKSVLLHIKVLHMQTPNQYVDF